MNQVNSNINNEELISVFKKGNYKEAISLATKIINIKPEYHEAYNIMALSYKKINKVDKAIDSFFRIIKRNPRDPKLVFIYSNTGNLFYEIGQIEKSIVFFKASLDLKPNNIDASLGLGLSLSTLGKDDESIKCYKSALKFNNNHPLINYHMAQSLRKLERYKEAVNFYSKTNYHMAKSYKLECMYQSIDSKEEKDSYNQFLNELNYENHYNPLIACLSSHSSIRFSQDDDCRFCKKPFDYIKKNNLFKNDEFNQTLIDDIILDINKSGITKKSQSLLKNGLQSSGNLFKLNYSSINKLEELILQNISEYRDYYSHKQDSFIQMWPKKYTMYGWVIIMKSGGNLLPHMHKEGWLSSSIYLKRPLKKYKSDGDLKFSLDGAGYKTDGKKYPETIVDISNGDIVMFPSSLFHSTIPFESNEDRVSLAFDLIPEA